MAIGASASAAQVPDRLEFDVIVVGGGCSGLAAAATCARAGLNTIVLERGRPGNKNVMGGVLYTRPTMQVYGEFWKAGAPVERSVVEQNLWILTEDSAIKVGYRSRKFAEEPPNAFTVLRARIDAWFAEQAAAAGALIVPNTKVEECILDGGRVVGVRTSRPDGDVYAPVTIICEGVNPQLTQSLGMQGQIELHDMSSVAKEVIQLSEQAIQERFHVGPGEGVTIELFGDASARFLGMGFLYTNRDTISIGIGVSLNDYIKTDITPHDMLQRLKNHPMIAPLIEGGEVREYSSHMIPEGGWRKMPQVYGDGVMICGDAAMLVNAVHREGSNHAILSGKLAAETAIEAHEKRDFSRRTLSAYWHKLWKRAPTLHDLRKYRYAMEYPTRHRAVLNEYLDLASYAAREMLTVDSETKREKQWKILRAALRARSIFGMAYDAVDALRLL
ncbi:MAG: FAD-dependent oxidoreductase [Armatimonadetes bacterium]|nr:FAD-dependent oxidoreductase [Armatimonadota bacterium]